MPKLVSKQQLALDFVKISWDEMQVSSDGPSGCTLETTVDRLMEMPQREAIHFLIQVIEAQQVSAHCPHMYPDIMEFNHID